MTSSKSPPTTYQQPATTGKHAKLRDVLKQLIHSITFGFCLYFSGVTAVHGQVKTAEPSADCCSEFTQATVSKQSRKNKHNTVNN